MSQPSHNDLILDQFTRQATPFSTASPITDAAALKLIVETSGAKATDTVLDVACGGGVVACAFAPRVKHVTGIDMTPAMLARSAEYAKELGLTNLTWQQGDVTSLPFKDGAFSIVFTRFSFHHFSAPLAVLKEMVTLERRQGRRQMTAVPSPVRWAIDLSLLLNTVLGEDHFPVDVPELALEYSAKRYPDDPISLIRGEVLPGFDGALYRAPAGKKGWGIFFNHGIASEGRINYTLAHEFGHYLMHRVAFPNGFRCGDQDVVRWDSEYGQIEHQANVFAANLLMPLDDYRRQIDARTKVDLDMISHCANRYRVSLVAALLRWLEYTGRRAVLIVSRDGFILWSRSSKRALKTGAFFRTSRSPVPIPPISLAARQDRLIDGRTGIDVPAGVWLPESVREMTIFADQYDFAVSLLMLADDAPPIWHDEEAEEDVYDRFTAGTMGTRR